MTNPTPREVAIFTELVKNSGYILDMQCVKLTLSDGILTVRPDDKAILAALPEKRVSCNHKPCFSESCAVSDGFNQALSETKAVISTLFEEQY